MFDKSIQRFVDDYHSINDQFRRFCRDVFLDVDSSNNRLRVMVNGNAIHEMTRGEYLNMSSPLIDTIGQTSRRRHFVLYHHLVSQGINVNP